VPAGDCISLGAEDRRTYILLKHLLESVLLLLPFQILDSMEGSRLYFLFLALLTTKYLLARYMAARYVGPGTAMKDLGPGTVLYIR
jgi:hypothetical protein